MALLRVKTSLLQLYAVPRPAAPRAWPGVRRAPCAAVVTICLSLSSE
jgi:hypothetical protein